MTPTSEYSYSDMFTYGGGGVCVGGGGGLSLSIECFMVI